MKEYNTGLGTTKFDITMSTVKIVENSGGFNIIFMSCRYGCHVAAQQRITGAHSVHALSDSAA
jgi:hypothetical protein